jgi:hypothetical protein
MPRILYLLLVIPTLAGAADDVICALGPDASSYSTYVDRRPTPDAVELVTKVMEALRPVCNPNCRDFRLLRNSTAPNAMFLSPAGERTIIYKPEFFTALYEASGEAGILAILAHEVGHVLDPAGSPAWFSREWTAELRADAWGACALAKLNLGARPLGVGLRVLAKYPSPAHPRWAERVPVLRTGYTQCGGDGTRFDAARP